jgi:hypothetical protein
MELSQKEKEGQEFLLSIYRKFWEDADFRVEFKEDPIKALNKFTGIEAKLPEDKMVVVEDQTNPNHVYLNIPPQPNIDDIELNDDQLEMVAGGVEEALYWDAVYAITTNPLDAIKYVMDHEQ